MLATNDCIMRWIPVGQAVRLTGYPILITFARSVEIADFTRRALTTEDPYRVLSIITAPTDAPGRRVDAECVDIASACCFSWEITREWIRCYYRDEDGVRAHNRLLRLLAADGWIVSEPPA